MRKTIYLLTALFFVVFGFSQKITTSIDSSQIKFGTIEHRDKHKAMYV